MSFTLIFSFHRQHWPDVMEELCRRTPCIDDEYDDGYDSPEATESWDNECNDFASFLDHNKLWAGVMKELGLFRRRSVVEMEMLLGCNDQSEVVQRQQPVQRPRKLLDRRGRSLSRLNFH